MLIETSRLILRGWNDDDIEAWAEMNADPRVMEFFPNTYERERSIANAIAMRAELELDGYGWLVAEIKEGARFAGVVALQEVPFKAHFTPAKEIAWRFALNAWGHGYATEAAHALLDFAFRQLGWREVVAMTAATNTRSRHVMERLAMTHDPHEDFDHPRLPHGHPLARHVLYRAYSGS